MREIKISVIIPIYQTGKLLLKCLNSIVNQSFDAFECILVDDGSRDIETITIAEKFVNKDKRFKLYRKNNEGIEKSRLYGVERANADFLIFCDHDDFYKRDAFKILIEAQQESHADIVSANCWLQPFYNYNIGRKKIVPSIDEEIVLEHKEFIESYYMNFFGLNSFPVSTWGKLYNKRLFDQEIQCYNVSFIEDIVINTQLFERACKIHFIPDSIYTHIYGGLSSKFNFRVVILGFASVYNFRKSLLVKYNLDFRPLLVEFKNVLIQNLDLLIDYDVEFNLLEAYMDEIKNTEVFQDLLAIGNINHSYITLIEQDSLVELYDLLKSKNTFKRKVKHQLKRVIRSL